MFGKRSVSGLLALLIGGWLVAASGSMRAAAPRAQQSGSASNATSSPARAVVGEYCCRCHNERLRTAGLALDTADAEHVSADGVVWEKVVRKLRAGTMPPAGMPRPDQPTNRSVISWLETELDKSAAAHPNPGRSARVHRLNRFEYQS